MPADKLGRYITSQAVFDRAKAAVAEAVRELEAKGIKPAYIVRESTSEATQEVLAEARARNSSAAFLNNLTKLSRMSGGKRLVDDATAAIASVLLLAKTAMPSEETKFLSAIREQLAQVRERPILVEWARVLIDSELSSDDVFRDRSVIDDALFARRIEAVRQALLTA
ncbi:hypothetical protein PQR67_25815 [Paraburkholderia fungorum]|uniref:hypothetical protein n=1 Tax=Paraburkholderia fungorum TaxID=134537 RepID=UPI0038B6BFB8